MKTRTPFLSVLVVLLVGVLGVLSPSCGETCCPPASDRVMNCDDGSQATVYAGTNIAPCNCMAAAYVAPQELPDPTCLPADSDVITAIDITPDGASFTPDGLLHFKLPAGHGYALNETLTIWQHTSGTCGGGSSNWIPEPGHATVIAGGFADGPMRHTSIFALVDMGGQISMFGTLAGPFTQQNGDIVFDIDVIVSSTHRQLEGQVVGIVVAGIEGDPARFMDILGKIPVGSAFAFQWDNGGVFTVWWEDVIVRFPAKDVSPR